MVGHFSMPVDRKAIHGLPGLPGRFRNHQNLELPLIIGRLTYKMVLRSSSGANFLRRTVSLDYPVAEPCRQVFTKFFKGNFSGFNSIWGFRTDFGNTAIFSRCLDILKIDRIEMTALSVVAEGLCCPFQYSF